MTDLPDPARYAASLLKVVAELDRQHEMWGEQDHPLLGDPQESRRAYYLDEAEVLKSANDSLAAPGRLGWDDILLEEVFEALSEEDPDKQYTELIQVAAVALNAAMSNRRNRKVADDDA